jgi:hypothetical protein
MHANVLDTPSHRQQSIRASGQAVLNQSASYLDSKIPLKDASHADVVSYSVETIWRKAECIATLACGRRVKLHDAWQFIGYTGHNPARFMLFLCNGRHVEVQIDTRRAVVAVEQNHRAGAIRHWFRTLVGRFAFDLGVQSMQAKTPDRNRIYTTIDGGQFTLAG